MLCSPDGCDVPEQDADQTETQESPQPDILYVTDPICSACWVMEAAWRKLLLHYGDQLNFQYVYGGLLPKWEGFRDVGAGISKPSDVIPHWKEVAQHYGQPINPDVWATDPLESSYPPSIALHVVRLLAPEKESLFLRKIREALFLDAQNIARVDHLLRIATDLEIDEKAFMALWNSPVPKMQFEADLQLSRQLPVRGFPTLIILDNERRMTVLHGVQRFQRMEQVIVETLGLTRSTQQFSLDTILERYQSGTFKELAEASMLDKQDLKQQLSQREGVEVSQDMWWHLKTPETV